MAKRYRIEFEFEVVGDGDEISDAAGEAMDAIEEKFREKEIRVAGGSWSRNVSSSSDKED